MTTAPDWLRQDSSAPPLTRWQRVRRASLGARLVYGSLAVVAVSLVVGAVDFGVALQSRNAERARLEQAAVDAVPAGLRVHARGIIATGAAAGYASAFSPLPPDPAADGVRTGDPDGGPFGWTPVAGSAGSTGLTAFRAWLNDDGDRILSVDVLSCGTARAPVGCPEGGSVVRVEVAPGGPNS